MSWSGGGGFFGPSSSARLNPGSSVAVDWNRETPVTTALPTDLDALRRFANDAYRTGRLAEAAEAQSAALTMARAKDVPEADDFLFAGLIHHAARRFDSGIAVLREGVGRYLDNVSLYENLAVLLLADFDIAGSIDACRAAVSFALKEGLI